MPARVRLPSISLIVARSYPGNVIGYNNSLPWHIKTDLKRFKRLTTGHAVIMGRSTFESIGHPLPNRSNIVMSKNPPLTNTKWLQFDDVTQLYWTDRQEDALFVADIISIWRGVDDIFVVGGEKMYDLFDKLVNKVYLTDVFTEVRGDAFFTKTFDKRDWKYLSEQDFPRNYEGDEVSHRFSIYERRERQFRYEFLTSF